MLVQAKNRPFPNFHYEEVIAVFEDAFYILLSDQGVDVPRFVEEPQRYRDFHKSLLQACYRLLQTDREVISKEINSLGSFFLSTCHFIPANVE